MTGEFVPCIRITVFIPASAAEEYITKIQDHIPSFLGSYDRVLWISDPVKENGTEQFRPLNGANPSQGASNETCREPSVKLELSVPDDRLLCEVLMRDILVPEHPWECPVILLQDVRIFSNQEL